MVMQATLFAGEAPPRCQIAVKSFAGVWQPTADCVQNLAVNPSFESVSGSVVVRSNLCPNPRAVAGAGGWISNSGSASSSYQTVGGPTADMPTWFRRRLNTSYGPGGMTISYGPNAAGQAVTPIPVVEGRTYTASLWGVYSAPANATRIVQVRVRWWDADGALIGDGPITSAIVSSGVWARLSTLPSVAPPGAAGAAASVNFVTLTAVAGDFIGLTGLLFEEATRVLPYFDGNTVVAGNPVVNPQAQQSGFTGWGAGTVGSTATRVIGGGGVTGGKNWFRLSWSAAPTGSPANIQTSLGSLIPVSGDRSYTVSADYFQTKAKPSGNRIDAAFYTSDGTLISSAVQEHWTPVAGVWARTSRTVTPPAGAALMRIGFAWSGYQSVFGAGDYVGVTAVRVTAVSDDPDDDAQYVSEYEYGWAGADNASASERRAPAVTGGGPNGACGWASTVWASTGRKALRVSPRGSAAASFYSPEGDVGGMRAGMVAGGTYTVMARCWLPAPQSGDVIAEARCIVGYYRDGAGVYQQVSSEQPPNAAGWTDLRLTLTIPGDATEAFVRLFNGAAEGGGDVWWDDYAIMGGVYTGGWFSGDTTGVTPENPFDSGVIYSWDGAVGGSPSRRSVSQFVPDSGNPFTTLRLYRDGVLVRRQPQSGQVAAVVDDYEFNREVPVTYRLEYAYQTAPGTVLSESLTLTADIADAWIIHPRTPALSLALSNVDDSKSGLAKLGNSSRKSTRTLHQIIGQAKPVVTSTGRRLSTSRTIEVETVTMAHWQQLLALLDDDLPVLFLIPPSWRVLFESGWYSVGDIDEVIPVENPDYDYRSWSLPVDAAVEPITVVESLWSRQALMDAGYTRQQLAGVWASRLDLMQNRRVPSA
ncbi:hypothetical protein QT381_02530 [Galbitalea sp. SE-J8]|uniref:hypothetical protein n=1 Tax=Galbitalea sp. SE-J8 TaxID=3054952 RepID=UPI00259D2D0F|nr:hypothetical protein [Galbitalea sp. SE-J8]MDM4761879.1 hypothetical protein [Galbitalea sp. SE-J8]